MTIVLTRPQNAVSAIKLGYPVVQSVSEIPNGHRVIRWGNSGEQDHRSWPLVLNKRQALEVSINKIAALEALSRTVKVPDYFNKHGQLPSGGRFVVRPDTHAEGSDFRVVSGGRVPEGHHATRLIEDAREYRVWFVREKLLVAKRVPRLSEGQSAEDICRSKWGYKFQSDPFPKLAQEVAKARTAIPLDFGAMDVLWKDGEDGEEGKWYFLEINSAPSLDHDRVLDFMKTNLDAILRTFDGREVLTVPPPAENAANRQPTRPTANVAPGVRGSPDAVPVDDWKAKFKAKLLAERKAEEARIYKEVYGDL